MMSFIEIIVNTSLMMEYIFNSIKVELELPYEISEEIALYIVRFVRRKIEISEVNSQVFKT